MTPFQMSLTILRDRNNLNNQELADYIGVSIHTVNKWLSGARQPNDAAQSLVTTMLMIEDWCPQLHELLVPRRIK